MSNSDPSTCSDQSLHSGQVSSENAEPVAKSRPSLSKFYVLWGWLNHSPLLLWGMMWLAIFGTSAIAISSLLNLNSSQWRSLSSSSLEPPVEQGAEATTTAQTPASSGASNPDSKPTPEEPSTESSAATPRLNSATAASPPAALPSQPSPWIFGAIALSCGLASLWLTKQLCIAPEAASAGARRSRHAPKRLAHYATSDRLPLPSKPKAALPVQMGTEIPVFPVVPPLAAFQPMATKLSGLAPHPAHVQPSTAAQPNAPMGRALEATAAPTGVPEAVPHSVAVDVMPTEQAHPLDWNEASLADLMDIRRQRSLNSLLAKP
jgi:hypothetical protein